MVSWNSLGLLRTESRSSPANHYIQTDASGSWGCGAFFEGNWLQWQWPNEWLNISIMAKELVPITLSCAAWGPKLTRTRVLIQCNNLGLVATISKGSSWDKEVMHLLRCMWFLVAYFDIDLHTEQWITLLWINYPEVTLFPSSGVCYQFLSYHPSYK